MDSSEPIKLGFQDVDEASKVLSEAFQEDSLLNYIFPNREVRKEKSPVLFKTEIKYGIKFGEVYATSNFEGVAVWVSPKYVDLNTLNMIKAGALAIPFKVGLKYMIRLLNTYDLSVIHKRLVNKPHWYLLVIGVDPTFQKIGYGTELMKFMLEKIDNEDLPCYLEVGKEENLEFYKRFGFKIIQVTDLSKIDTTIWSMYRKKISNRN